MVALKSSPPKATAPTKTSDPSQTTNTSLRSEQSQASLNASQSITSLCSKPEFESLTANLLHSQQNFGGLPFATVKILHQYPSLPGGSALTYAITSDASGLNTCDGNPLGSIVCETTALGEKIAPTDRIHALSLTETQRLWIGQHIELDMGLGAWGTWSLELGHGICA